MMGDLPSSETLKNEPTEKLPDDVHHLNKHNLIGVGVFAHVHRLDERRVRKMPAPHTTDLDLAITSIRREGQIYNHLGNHDRVIKCLATGDHFVDLEYAPNGHIEDYLKRHQDISNERRVRFAREIIEAVEFVHSKGIIHSDLAARQFLLDSTLHAKLSDFGFSSFSKGDALGFEVSSHHLPRDIDSKRPSTIRSDLFALGSTLYEVMTGTRPYEGREDDNIVQLYRKRLFPDVTGVIYGHVILDLWLGRFKSAATALEHFPAPAIPRSPSRPPLLYLKLRNAKPNDKPEYPQQPLRCDGEGIFLSPY
jgi:serine/threonine protein kinase